MSLSRAAPMVATTLLVLVSGCEGPPLGPATPADGPEPASDVASGVAAGSVDDLIIRDVALEPGVTADIHVRLFVNEQMPCAGRNRTAAAIPGSSHTANSFNRLAEELFTGPRETRMCTLVAVNFPGHGSSSLPEGDLLFGQLRLEHYVATIAGVLDRLPRLGIEPGAVIGQSQGTMVIQMLQAQLVAAGTNLHEAYGIQNVVLLGPNMPAALPWLWTGNTAIFDLLGTLLTEDERLGQYIRGPAWAFQAAWFINLSGDIAPLAPAVETIEENGWNSRLPLFANLQTLGADPFGRPAIPSGIFAARERTELQIVNMADDPASLPFEGRALMEYLTGEPDAPVSLVVDPSGSHSAVHSAMLIPELVDDVRAAIELPRRP